MPLVGKRVVTGKVLQPTYDTRYGFSNGTQNNQQTSSDVPPESPLTKDPSYTLSDPDIPSSLNVPEFNKSDIYAANIYKSNEYKGGEFSSPDRSRDYGSPDRREFNGDRLQQHKR